MLLLLALLLWICELNQQYSATHPSKINWHRPDNTPLRPPKKRNTTQNLSDNHVKQNRRCIWYLYGKAVAVERGLQMLVKAWGLECPVLPLGEQEEAGGVGQRQGLPRGVEQGLLAPTQRRWLNARHLTSGKYGSSEIRSCG